MSNNEDISHLPKEVQDIIEAARKNGAEVKVINLTSAGDNILSDVLDEQLVKRSAMVEEFIRNGGELTDSVKIKALMGAIDYFCGGQSKQSLRERGLLETAHEKVWPLLEKNGYTMDTLNYIMATYSFCRETMGGSSSLLAASLNVMEYAYPTTVPAYKKALVDLHEAINNNVKKMYDILVEGGIYERE